MLLAPVTKSGVCVIARCVLTTQVCRLLHHMHVKGCRRHSDGHVWSSAGCDVAVIDPDVDATFGVPLPLSAADVAAALDGVQRRVGAVLVTSPTYEGLCGDLFAISQVCWLSSIERVHAA